MKTVTIDFTKTPAEISDRILGHQGEKNRTRLIITPPAEMTDEPKVISYAVAFQIGAHKVAHSEICDKADTITVLIDNSVSKTNVISLQLEGYDGEETLLMKSERITDLVFEPSVTGEEYDGGDESALAEQVAFIKNIVEKGTDRPTAVTEVPFSGMISLDETNGTTIRLDDQWGQLSLPVGTEIKQIEFKPDDSEEWTAINQMHEKDGLPYFCNMSKVFLLPNDSKCLAFINYPLSAHASYLGNIISAYTGGIIRITYYTDTMPTE